MKKSMRVLTIVLLISFLVGCAQTPQTPQEPQAPTAPQAESPDKPEVPTEPKAPTEPELNANEKWAQQYGFGPYMAAEEDWAAVEEAAIKEGKVVVYSNSSRITRIVDAWKALYPQIELEVFDLGSDAVITKVREEQEAKAYTGDVAMGSGAYFAVEFVPLQYFWKYFPPELSDVLPPMNQDPLVTHSLETYGWVYNTQLNESCPISNWWEPTEEEWKGKVAINKDPITSGSDMGMLTSISHHTEELAAMYQERYGKEWTEDEDYDTDTTDAGLLWLKKVAQNEWIAGADEAWSVMGAPGLTENILGLFWYSKYRKVIDGEAYFEPCVEMNPVGVQKHNYLAIVNQAPHPNAAKLYMKFALTAEGLTPWNQVGQVPGRTDVAPADEAVPFLELPVWQLDEVFCYENVSAYHEFFSFNMLTK